jgi:hypothetical protein
MTTDIPTIKITGFDPLRLELQHVAEPITRVNIQLPPIRVKLLAFDMMGVGGNDEFNTSAALPAPQVLVTFHEPTSFGNIISIVTKSADHWRDLWNEAQAALEKGPPPLNYHLA